MLALGGVAVGGDLLDALAEPVVDIVEPAVLEVEGVASASAAVREERTVRVGGLDGHARGDRERSSSYVHRDRLWHVGGVRVVNVAVARLAGLWARRSQDLPRRPVV